MNYNQEINEISRMIESAALMQSVRNAVSQVVKDGYIVTDGKHHNLGSDCDLVIKCCEKDVVGISRRIRGSIPNVDVSKLSRGVLSVKSVRRGC